MAHIRFDQSSIDCESSQVCYNLQLKAEPDSLFLFKGINLRIFYDFEKLNVDTFSTNLGFYSGSFLGDNPISAELGFSDPHYYQYNLTGIDFESLLLSVDSSWATFGEICFFVMDPPTSEEDYCESLVFDLSENGAGSITGLNEGVVISRFNQGLTLGLIESPINDNWVFDSDVTGHAESISCVSWPCSQTCETIVSNHNDSGLGSLRGAIACANNNDTIFFAQNLNGDSIHLTTNPIIINKNLTLFPHFSQPIVVTSEASNVLMIDNADLTIHNINIVGGSELNGAAIVNNGTTHLKNVGIWPKFAFPASGILVLNNGELNFYGNSFILKNP